MGRISRSFSDDSGFILRGGWAVAFLAFMFVMAVFGQIPWEGFGLILLASLVLTGLGALFSRPTRSTFAPVGPPARPLSAGALSPSVATDNDSVVIQVRCTGCGVSWDLDEEEASLPSFTCPECGSLMDAGRFTPAVTDAYDLVAAQVQCIGCGVIWDLDEEEASLASFTCPECGSLMDAGRFTLA